MNPNVITAYLDESGDFDMVGDNPKREPWVVGGMIVAGENNAITSSLAPAVRKLAETIKTKPWFATIYTKAEREVARNVDLDSGKRRLLQDLIDLPREPLLLHRASFVEAFRRFDPTLLDTALLELDSEVFSALRQLSAKAQIFVVVHFGRKTSHSPTNYAVLMQEFVSILCNNLALQYQGLQAPVLQFVIARRRNADHQAWVHGLNIDQLKIAIANGLSSAGALRFLDSSESSVRIVSAEQSPALAIADFICGHSRNVVSREGFDKAGLLLGKMGVSLHRFETSPSLKRIQLAVSTGNFVESLFTLIQEPGHGLSQLASMVRRWLSSSSDMQVRFDAEALMNRLDHWSRSTEKATYISALLSLDSAIDECLLINVDVAVSATLEAVRFRLKAYILMWANHLGDSSLAAKLTAQLSELRESVKGDPLIMEALFQHEIGWIEQAINDHQFKEAELLAGAHMASITLLAGSGDQSKTHHASARGTCLELRCNALSASSSGDREQLMLVLELAGSEFRELHRLSKNRIHASSDSLVRLLQVEGYCAEVLGDVDVLTDVLDRLVDLMTGQPNIMPYGVALLARMLGSLALLSSAPIKLNNSILSRFEGTVNEALQSDLHHPNEIMVREWMLWAHRTARLTDSDGAVACDVIESWASMYKQSSEVLRHQVRVGLLAVKFVRGLAIQERLTEREAEKSAFYRSQGIGSHESQLLAIRAETIY